MYTHQKNIKDTILRPLIAAIIGLLAGGLFVLLTGNAPLEAFQVLLKAGYGCSSGDNCAILTTLQFATPLIFMGLSAAVAFRVGIFSIGQMGQMLLGAAAANWIASRFALPFIIHPLTALIAATLFGMTYAILPAILKLHFNINEILSTILLNYIALYLVGFIPS
ncbi:MAG: ABC transporter permease, partial [Anaerolineaceae bacterium]|nr:ABC transporter permease [Anaerolineaceae bacterium]